jgi:signal transduction histidine kinase
MTNLTGGSEPAGGTDWIDVVAVGDPIDEQTRDALGAHEVAITVEDDVDAGLARLNGEDVDCVLCGTSLDQLTLTKVFEAVRERDDTVPFVVVTAGAYPEIEPAVECIVRDAIPTEQEVEYLARRLHQRVATSSRLTHCEQTLERQTDRFEQFVTVISHDLRNPLNVARSSAKLLERDGPHFDRLDRSLHRIDSIIEEGVTFARQDSTVERTAPADIETFALDLWDTIATDDGTLETESSDPVLADPDRLRELLEQLLENAVEHGDTPVTVGTVEDGFYVADTGSGVPDRARQRALEPGVSTAQETGLGLAIVDEIARAHDWTVSLGDGATGGTRVEITGVEFY